MIVNGIRNAWLSLHRRSAVAAHILLTTGANIAVIVLGMVTGVLAARLLGPTGRGELAAIQLWAGFFAMLAVLGMPDALAYFAAKEPANSGRLLTTATALGLIAAPLFMLIGYLLLPVLLEAQSSETLQTARMYLWFIPLSALIGIPYHVLRGRGDFISWNALRFVPALGWLGLLVVALLSGRSSVEFLAIGHLLVLTAAIPLVLSIVIRRTASPYQPDWTRWHPLIRYGMPSVLSNVPQLLNLRLDQMMMAIILPAQSLGFYAVAVGWSAAVNPLINALGTVLFPRIAGQSNKVEQADALAFGSRIATLISLTVGIAVLITTPIAVPLLFGNPYLAAVPVALVLVVAGVISGINGVLEEGLRGLGLPSSVLWAELGGLVITVLALLFLLEPLEIMGAGISSVIGYGSITALLLIQAQRATQLPVKSFLQPTRAEVTLVFQRLLSMLQAIWTSRSQ